MTNQKTRGKGSFLQLLHAHSLGLAAIAILATWTMLYARSDPETRSGEFFGNSVADWSGTVLLVFGTKYLFEVGSTESKRVPQRFRHSNFLVRHSLTIFLVVTGVGLFFLYRAQQPQSRWGPVTGNILSEWIQMIGIVFLTTRLMERGSKESRGR